MKRVLLMMAAMAGSKAMAQSVNYDFDDFTLGTYQNAFSQGGLVFSAHTNGPDNVNISVESAVGRLSSGLSDHIITFGEPFVPSSLIHEARIAQADNSAFKLESVWVGDAFGNANLRFTAYRDGTPAGYEPLDINIFNTARQVTFTGWDHLTEIRITNSQGASDLNFEIDDLVLAPAVAVPEPSSVLLMALGVGLLRRRR